MLHPKIGSVCSWKPDAFCDTSAQGVPRTVRGTIVYINEAHHYFTAEAVVNGVVLRESFKTI